MAALLRRALTANFRTEMPAVEQIVRMTCAIGLVSAASAELTPRLQPYWVAKEPLIVSALHVCGLFVAAVFTPPALVGYAAWRINKAI